MGKVVIVCLRNPVQGDEQRIKQHLEKFLRTLCPDHLQPAPQTIAVVRPGLWLGIFNPSDPQTIHDCNAYVGWLAEQSVDWWRIGTPAPSGSHAMVRTNARVVEVLADYAASRPMWTGLTDQLFIASTSQRAIPWFLGAFQPDPQAQAWMLSAGTLGPASAWDQRIRRLAPGETVRLERGTWRVTSQQPPLEFCVDPAPDSVHTKRLRSALETTFSDLSVDLSRWVLPLSGGYDSRAILLLMGRRKELQTVTWGTNEALRRPYSDACIARRVASKLNVRHCYHETDLSSEPVEKLIDRYLVAGDGCTDGLWAYLDGFHTWRSFYSSGVRGVIRGDHGFGPGPAASPVTPMDVRHFVGLTRWGDYPEAPSLNVFGLGHLEEQPLPPALDLAPGESLIDWRDRLYQAYRIPAYIAAQSELKATYVEIASPFLVREILALTRSHPTHLREGKAVFRMAIAPYDIGIRYAVEPALVTQQQFLTTARVAEWLSDQLSSRRLRGAFTSEFADFLLRAFAPGDVAPRSRATWLTRSRRRARYLIPPDMRPAFMMKRKRKLLDLRLVALRACIASLSLDRLSRDARAIKDDLGEHCEAPPTALTG